ncbi:MAG: serine/threonine-protein kinase [Candidatus Eremiobacterota bacterium]
MRTLVLLALLSLPAPGETRLVTVIFHTRPEGARVYVNNSHAGVSGEPVLLELNPEAKVDLSFELDGFRKATRSTHASVFFNATRARYPEDGSVILLQPATPAAFLRVYPAPLAAGALLMVGAIAVFGRQRQKLARARQVEQMIAEAPPEASRVAVRVGGYLLVGSLGGGGMAQVYRGVPEQTLDPRRAVAVKLLHRNLADQQDWARRFEREVDVCRRLDHPNIVRLLDWGTLDGQTFLVMELVEGGTLRQRVRPGGLPAEEAARLLEPVFQAVAYAHELGVVHRDLKPENVLLTAGGVPKVSDFGLARATDSETLTQTGAALGTPAYMAPEQVCGQHLDPAVDQYALGVLAYELLTGRKPFENPDPVQLIFMHVSENASPPSTHRPDLPAGVDAAIMRMLSKEPGSRYPSVEEAGASLLEALR